MRLNSANEATFNERTRVDREITLTVLPPNNETVPTVYSRTRADRKITKTGLPRNNENGPTAK